MHLHPVRVRWSDLDSYAHLNHAVYLSMCETARIELLEGIGWGLLAMQSSGFQLVVVEITAKFLASAEYGDDLTIHSDVVDVGRASTRWHQEMRRGDEQLFTLEVKAAMTDLGGKLVRPPAEFLDALRAIASG